MDAFAKATAPSLDQPFGVPLWPLFSALWRQFRAFPPEDFRFEPGRTPLSTLGGTGAALVTYYAVVFGGRELMKPRPAFQLNAWFKVHNLFLTLLSAGMLVLFVEQMLGTVVRHGVFYSICDARGGWTDKLVVVYYLNYITKYIELLDTVFLVLKKKPLTFLHTYHHGATALLCYTQLVGLTPISWVPISLNLLVHVVMYWYYFQSARGIRVWWKEWITRLQIAQFVIDLGFVYFASYTYFTSTYFPWMPNHGRCAGEEFAAISGCVILSSYLLLFISFYLVTYTKQRKGSGGRDASKHRPRRSTATEATIGMARFEIPGGDKAGKKGKKGGGSGREDEGANGSANGGVTPRTTRSTRSRKA